MNLSDIGIVFGLTTSLMAGGGAAGNYWLSHEYVPISALIERDARETRKDIRALEYDRDHGGLTDKEQWLLDQYIDDLEELERQLNQ